ncbi:MAG: hypothetical protein WB036_09695, partial [Pseudolabrys sp.]
WRQDSCSSDGDHGVLGRNGLHPRFGGGCFACYRAATKAEHDGNRRKATIFGIASIAILIAGLVIESHFDIFPDDDDGD